MNGFRPTHGPHSGGNPVRIDAINLMPRGSVLCRFGKHESYGYLDTSDGALYCLTPATSYITSETLYLKLDQGNDWIDTGMNFHFSEPIIIESIFPLEIDFGTEYINVKGQGFSREVDLF